MKKIYILLMHTNTLPSKVVKAFTRYEYSHVALSLTKDCYTTYSFGRKELYNILNGGLSVQEKNGEFFTKFNNTVCKIYEVEVTYGQYKKVREIISKMTTNIDDYKYDFLGIIPRLLGIPVTFKNKFVCSYFVAEILRRAGICDFGKKTCLVVPKNFENLNQLKKIYTGSYLEYT